MPKLTAKKWVIIAVVMVVVLWLITAAAGLALWNSDAGGKFGDFFGAANALFSGLALAGVVYAILLQQEELQLQRKELEETRAELKRSAEAQLTSAELAHRQLHATQEGLNEQRARYEQSLQPRFVITAASWSRPPSGKIQWSLTVENFGAEVFEYAHVADSTLDVAAAERIFNGKSRVELQVAMPPGSKPPFLAYLTFGCLDGVRGIQGFTCPKIDGKRELSGPPRRSSS